jgi:integrase
MARKALVVAAVEKGAVVRVAGARARVMDMAVTPQTLRGYDGRVKILQTFATQIGRTEIDEDVWFAFAETFAAASVDGQRSALDAYRCAVQHYQQAGRLRGTWAGDAAVTRSCKAVMFAQGVRKACTRGAVEPQQLKKLVEWFRREGLVDMADFAEVLYGAYLRISELANSRKADVEDDPAGLRYPNKGFRMSTMNTQDARVLRLKEDMQPAAWAIIQRRRAETGKSDLLFPCACFRVHNFRKELRRAVAELGWDARLVMDVPHAFRHGGAQEAMRDGRGVQMSAESKCRYLRNNAEREERLRLAKRKS